MAQFSARRPRSTSSIVVSPASAASTPYWYMVFMPRRHRGPFDAVVVGPAEYQLLDLGVQSEELRDGKTAAIA